MKTTKKLKKNREFEYIFRNGQCCKGKYIDCFYKKNNNQNNNYLGIAVSSKLCNAVKRNRIKRIIMAAYTKIEQNITLGNTIILLWKKNVEIEKCIFDNVYDDLTEILKRIGMFDEENYNRINKDI